MRHAVLCTTVRVGTAVTLSCVRVWTAVTLSCVRVGTAVTLSCVRVGTAVLCTVRVGTAVSLYRAATYFVQYTVLYCQSWKIKNLGYFVF